MLVIAQSFLMWVTLPSGNTRMVLIVTPGELLLAAGEWRPAVVVHTLKGGRAALKIWSTVWTEQSNCTTEKGPAQGSAHL